MFEQVKLDYAFDALEPHIDTMTMESIMPPTPRTLMMRWKRRDLAENL